MASQETPNYRLSRWAGTDRILHTEFNDNWDKIDTALKSSADKAAALQTGRLLLLSETLPDAPFSAARALARNHTIYALGKNAIVVAARNGVGGSWRGATAGLCGNFSSVYVPDGDGADFEGNRALFEYGARRIDLSGKRTIGEQLCVEEQISFL